MGVSALAGGAAVAASAFAFLGVAAHGPVVAAAQGAEKPPIRLCADPDNLPFTSNSASKPGFYGEVARLLAEQLGRRLEPVWASTYYAKRMLRTTLLAHTCDMFFGLPYEPEEDGKRVLLSTPLLDVGYALVVPKSSGVQSPEELKGKRVAVQFGTPPQAEMADRDDVEALTVTSPEEGMQALEKGRADAALLWGPSAGYLNATALGSRYRIAPLGGKEQWSAAIAFAPGSEALRDKVNALLAQDGPAIRALAQKYAMPLAERRSERAGIVLVANSDSSGFGEDLQIPEISKGAPLPPDAPRQKELPAGEGAGSSAGAAPPPADGKQISEGRDLFNSTCAHCHGPNAIQSERRINLRLLRHRYGDEMDKVFFTTVASGRPDKGMPSWNGVFNDAQFKSILAFLRSVQEQ